MMSEAAKGEKTQGITKKSVDASEKRRTNDVSDNSYQESSLSIDTSSRAENITQGFGDLTAYDDNGNGLVRSGENAEGTRYHHQIYGSTRHEYVYHNRPRRFDELREKAAPLDPRMTNRDFYARENYYPDPNFQRQPYRKHYTESFPRTNVPDMQGYVFRDPLRLHLARRRSTNQAHTPPYADEKTRPYPSNFGNHRHLCSCYQCLNDRHVPLPPTAYRDKYADLPSGKMFGYHHREKPGEFGPRTRWRGEVNRGAQRVQLASSKLHVQQHRRPVAGGAPFMTCFGCFELLVLPERVVDEGCNRIKCGACSAVFSLVLSKEEKLIMMLLKEKNSIPSVVPTTSGKNLDKESTVVSSGDCDYDFQSKDREEAGDLSTGHEGFGNSTSYCASEVEKDSEKLAEDLNLTPQKKECKSVECLRPPAGSPLFEHFEFSNKYHRGKPNPVGPVNDEALLACKKPAVMHKKDSSATEIDLSSNEYYNNTGTTLDSGEASGVGDNKLEKGDRNKSAESLLVGALRRSFKDSNRIGEAPKQEKVKVTVNGHAIPNEMVHKAQKLAGRIQPGNYWYDFRAGFWGVEGGPCLGVIPPYIDEFNYPMPVNCAGGNTNIFVNGRELHHKDLSLLASRGLPTMIHRSYIIEISGRVLDESSGEELESLGKLAPTVERAKHGFGMKVPKAAA